MKALGQSTGSRAVPQPLTWVVELAGALIAQILSPRSCGGSGGAGARCLLWESCCESYEPISSQMPSGDNLLG